MKFFLILTLSSFSCFASETNFDYAAIAAEEDASNMILSNETNSLRSGVWINNTNHVLEIRNGQMVSEAALAMLNTSTNDVNFWWYWPSTELQYEINLVDGEDHIVPKTSLGKRFGCPPKINPEGRWVIEAQPKLGLHMTEILPKGDSLHSFPNNFDPVKYLPKYFEIEKAGRYKLTLIHHIYTAEFRTNRYVLKSTVFSPVTINVRIEK